MTAPGWIARLEEGLIALLLAAMTLITFVQVVLRYLFGSGFVWALEATTYLFAWLVMLGISYGVRRRAHIGVEAAVTMLPQWARRPMALIACAAALVYAALMAYGAWRYVDRLAMIGNNARDIPLPRWLLTTCLPLGFALLILRLLEATWGVARGRAPGLVAPHRPMGAMADAPAADAAVGAGAGGQ